MSNAKIYSQGYSRYDGPRNGTSSSIVALQKQSLRQGLGLGRKFRFKLAPIYIILSAYLPTILYIGIAVLFTFNFPQAKDLADEIIPSYADFFGYINFAVIIMAAFMIPSLLCNDRRNGMLGVYLSSPLNRTTYLLGKAWASIVMLLPVVLLPVLLLLMSRTLIGNGPDGFVKWLETFYKIIIGAGIIGIFYTSISLAISSLTDRFAIASSVFLAVVYGSTITSNMLIGAGQDDSSLVKMMNFEALPRAIVQRIFGEIGFWDPADIKTSVLWLAWILISGISLAIVWIKYNKLVVRR